MNLTSSRRADEFDRLLQRAARTDDPVDAPLLALAQALQAVPAVDGPRPEFRQALRQRLVAVATVQGVSAPAETPLARVREAGRTWRVQRRLTALAAGAAVVTGVTGVGLGASRSLPGDPFYGVKRAAEGVQLATTVGTEARGKRHLEFARTRLHEVQSLAGSTSAIGPVGSARVAAGSGSSGSADRIAHTLQVMDVETRDGANDLLQAFRDSGSIEPLRALSSFSAEQYAQLQALLPSLPAQAQPSARASLALLAVVATRTVDSARSAGTPPPGAPAPAPVGSPTPTPTVSGSTAPRPRPGASTSTATSPSSTGSPRPMPTSSPALPTSLPTSTGLLPGATTSVVPLPSIATIPPLLDPSTPLPTVLPSISELPTLPALPGLGG